MSRTAWAAISLLLVAIAWGAAFVLMKDAIKLQPIYDFLALRFTLAAGVMVLLAAVAGLFWRSRTRPQQLHTPVPQAPAPQVAKAAVPPVVAAPAQAKPAAAASAVKPKPVARR